MNTTNLLAIIGLILALTLVGYIATRLFNVSTSHTCKTVVDSPTVVPSPHPGLELTLYQAQDICFTAETKNDMSPYKTTLEIKNISDTDMFITYRGGDMLRWALRLEQIEESQLGHIMYISQGPPADPNNVADVVVTLAPAQTHNLNHRGIIGDIYLDILENTSISSDGTKLADSFSKRTFASTYEIVFGVSQQVDTPPNWSTITTQATTTVHNGL